MLLLTILLSIASDQLFAQSIDRRNQPNDCIIYRANSNNQATTTTSNRIMYGLPVHGFPRFLTVLPPLPLIVPNADIFSAGSDFPNPSLRQDMIESIATQMRLQATRGDPVFSVQPHFVGTISGRQRILFAPTSSSMGFLETASSNTEDRVGTLDLLTCPIHYAEEAYSDQSNGVLLPGASCDGFRIMLNFGDSGFWLRPLAKQIVIDFCREGAGVTVRRYIVPGSGQGLSFGRDSQIDDDRVVTANNVLMDAATQALLQPRLYATSRYHITERSSQNTNQNNVSTERPTPTSTMVSTTYLGQVSRGRLVTRIQADRLQPRQTSQGDGEATVRGSQDGCRPFEGHLGLAGLPDDSLRIGLENYLSQDETGAYIRVQPNPANLQLSTRRDRNRIMSLVADRFELSASIDTELSHLRVTSDRQGVTHMNFNILGITQLAVMRLIHAQGDIQLRRCAINYDLPTQPFSTSCHGRRVILDMRDSSSEITQFLQGVAIDYCEGPTGMTRMAYAIRGNRRSYIPWANTTAVESEVRRTADSLVNSFDSALMDVLGTQRILFTSKRTQTDNAGSARQQQPIALNPAILASRCRSIIQSISNDYFSAIRSIGDNQTLGNYRSMDDLLQRIFSSFSQEQLNNFHVPINPQQASSYFYDQVFSFDAKRHMINESLNRIMDELDHDCEPYPLHTYKLSYSCPGELTVSPSGEREWLEVVPTSQIELRRNTPGVMEQNDCTSCISFCRKHVSPFASDRTQTTTEVCSNLHFPTGRITHMGATTIPHSNGIFGSTSSATIVRSFRGPYTPFREFARLRLLHLDSLACLQSLPTQPFLPTH